LYPRYHPHFRARQVAKFRGATPTPEVKSAHSLKCKLIFDVTFKKIVGDPRPRRG